MSVTSVIEHLFSFARFSARRGAREHSDASVMKELANRPLALPGGLELQWLGVAGYRLTFQSHTIYIDPYLSRLPLSALLRSRPARVDPLLYERHLGDGHGIVEGILVGHTHFDHAIDVPALAARFDTKVYGSTSMVNLMALHGQRQRAVAVTTHHAYELGPFTVRFIPSLHSKLLLGYRVPFDGELSCEHLDQLSPSAYRCGPVYGIHITVAGTSFYHQGSANLVEEALVGTQADVFLAGIAGRSFTVDYWPRILRALQPRVVIASHFDDFFRSISDPIGFSTNVNLSAFPEEIAAVSREIEVAALEPMQTIAG
ncbi:MAG TPA: MBL fold metallo-hydrolase [Solirubrobacteraceae bacterium]|jgi:L-ascorbate metabolism protein UlaG (beta-lactamase superfamily)